MNSEKPLAIIYTEGKTDWQLLRKAKEKLNLDMNIGFYEFSHRMGDEELLIMCRAYARQPHPDQLQIFIFDRDNPKIIKEVQGKDESYKAWGNNVFSFPIPIPDHRVGYEHISIEFYFVDDEIKTADSEGRRLFLTSEFDERTGSHKVDPLIHAINQKDVKEFTEEKKAKIVDSEIGVVKGDQHIALSKSKFTKYICDEVAPFNNFNFEPFRKIFDIIEEILRNEILPSIQPESIAEELPPRFFIGREEEFDTFEKYLGRNKPISIEGLGGVGKTEFARKCIEPFHLEKNTVWFPCTRESKLDSLIEVAGFSDLLKVEKLTELAKYSGFATLIERHEKVLFLDDFQEITDPSFAKFLQFADKRLQKSKLILITRELPEVGVSLSRIPLYGLDRGDALQYAQHLIEENTLDINIPEHDLDKICQQVKGHPLAIELAIDLLEYGKSPENILYDVVEYEDEERLAHRLLDEILNHPKSTEEEKDFMLAFSVFRGKVKEQAVNYLFEGRHITSTIRTLRRKLMLMYEDGFYETHPLVREFCHDRLPNKPEWHKKAAEYFITERTEQLDPVLEEKIFFHLSSSEQWQEVVDIICNKGEQFIRSGYADALKEMMETAINQGIQKPQFDLFYGDIAEIQYEWDKALHYFEQAFSSSEADEKIRAQGKIRYGEILSHKGEVKESLAYFEQGYEMCRHLHFQQGEARSLNDIGLAYIFLGDLGSARMKIEESLKLRQAIGDISDIANSLNCLGGILHEQGDLQGAWNKYQHSLALWEEINDKSGMAVSLNNLGNILHVQGDSQGAWDKHQCSLALQEEIGDKYGIAMSLNNLGGILHDQGDLQGAWEKHQRSLALREEIGDKRGVAMSLNNLGSILHDQGDLQGAWDRHQRSLALQEEIGAKPGIATSLHNLGKILQAQGDLEGAWGKYQQSLRLSEEIGDKPGIANSLHNLGALAYSEKKYSLALQYFLKSKMIQNQVGIKSQETNDYIFGTRKDLGLKHFRIALQEALQQFPDDLMEYVNLDEFTQDTTIRRTTPKVGRNDPCPCGSGKKYKKCCGR